MNVTLVALRELLGNLKERGKDVSNHRKKLIRVELRSDESDLRVRAAFLAMAAAAEAYDDVLYDVYNEVTPFEIPSQYAEQDADHTKPHGATSSPAVGERGK